ASRTASRLAGQGSEWATGADTSATTGCPACKAAATTGRTSSGGAGNMAVYLSARREESRALRRWPYCKANLPPLRKLTVSSPSSRPGRPARCQDDGRSDRRVPGGRVWNLLEKSRPGLDHFPTDSVSSGAAVLPLGSSRDSSSSSENVDFVS